MPSEIDVVAGIKDLSRDQPSSADALRRCDDRSEDIERDTGRRLRILSRRAGPSRRLARRKKLRPAGEPVAIECRRKLKCFCI
jgi:hypothetical protein